nr:hypothetical protein [Candidatus Sigynarchaeota archaeon]
MTSTTVIFDTNFFVGIIDNARSDDAIFDFVRMLRVSFDENDIEAIIPFRVVQEIEQFHKPLSSFVESKFRIYKSIDINKDQFFLNLKWINLERHPDNRWFNVNEITDLEIITVAKHIADDDNKIPWVVTNDEGIQKAVNHLLKNTIKIIEPAAFLGYMIGVTNDSVIRTEFEHMSKLVFKHFTRYRERFGRAPVSQLDQFFAGMLFSIKMARDDAREFFDDGLISLLDNYLSSGIWMDNLDILVYKPAMSILHDILNENDASCIKTVDERIRKLNLLLLDLPKHLKEPTNYTRFYNYISPHIARAHALSFKAAFLNHELDRAFFKLELAKVILQPHINHTTIFGLFISIIILEFAARLVSGHAGGTLNVDEIAYLNQLACMDKFPPHIPEEHVNLILFVNTCIKTNIEEDGKNIDEVNCKIDEVSRILPLAEEFADESMHFGNMDLALRIYSFSHQKAIEIKDANQRMRLEGKIYLTCIIMHKNAY